MTDRLFVYGTLQPGASHWRLLEPLVTGTPRPATLPGALYDTGRGYPALSLGESARARDERGQSDTAGPGVPGWVVELRSPTEWSEMDTYEGPEYRREQVRLADGTECWTYVWIEGFDGMRLLDGAWVCPKP